MRKKMLSLALALIMCLSLMPSAFAAETVSASDKFTDVPADAWYLGELNYALANKYISGTTDTTFSPDENLTRGQFVTLLGRMLNVPTISGETPFTDVDAAIWYAPYVAWAAENGYVNGTTPTAFSPDDNITVEQMGTVLANYISKSGVELSGYTSSAAYTDASSISPWATSNMEQMQKYGLLVTDAAGNVNPSKSVNRAEGTVSLVRFAKAAGLGEEPIITQKPADPQSPITSQNPAAPQKPTLTGITDFDAMQYCEYTLEMKGYEAAVQVHDDLWSSGKLTSSMTQKQKARVYYDWLIQHCVYGDSLVGVDWKPICEQGGYEYTSKVEFWLGLDDPHFYAYVALAEGRAVCEGYSKAYKVLLTLEGIECDLVASFNGLHMWNSAVLDGTLYHIDVTWGDYPGYADKYFCMTEEAAWARFGGKEEGGFTGEWIQFGN